MISRHRVAQMPWRAAWLRKGGHFLHFPIFRYKIGAKLRPWHHKHCLGRNSARNSEGSTTQYFMISRHTVAQRPWRAAWLRNGGHCLHFPIFGYKIGAKLRPWHYEHCLGSNLATDSEGRPNPLPNFDPNSVYNVTGVIWLRFCIRI